MSWHCARQGAGNEAAVTAASIPPLSGGPDIHGSAAAHAITIAGSAGGDLRLVEAAFPDLITVVRR
ncbi:MAG: hypothetical protein JOY82_08030 [Streptosporangiaceae bacterium]|nr:hypothetical protein [Streptosporangiaceae bacterium]